MQVNRTNNVNFTSVVPLRVFVDGLPSTDVTNIKKAVVATAKILAYPAKGNEKSLSIIRKFIKYDRDYSYTDGGYKSGYLIRNYVKDGVAYLFTGEHAKIINECGKKIGPAKSAGVTKLARSLAIEYFNKIKEFISYPKIRIKEFVNPRTRMYEGDSMELQIHVKSKGKAGKRGYKLEVENIDFTKVTDRNDRIQRDLFGNEVFQ